MPELLSVRMDEELAARLDALTESWGASRSEAVRRAVLLAADGLAAGTVPQPAYPDTAPDGLGRVDLVVPVRPESIAWLDDVARVCDWTREQAARQALSEGRQVLVLKFARRPGRGPVDPRLRVVPEEPVPAAEELEGAPTPA